MAAAPLAFAVHVGDIKAATPAAATRSIATDMPCSTPLPGR
jgi:hypothetical protein